MTGKDPVRVLALYPSSRGIGYALMDEERRLVDWGTRGVRGDAKNNHSMRIVTALIRIHDPTVLVLEDVDAKGTKRHLRVKRLHAAVHRFAKRRGLTVRAYSRDEVFSYFGVTTKHDLALTIACALPALQLRLPPKRKPWMSEDARQSLFDAAALALRVLSDALPA